MLFQVAMENAARQCPFMAPSMSLRLSATMFAVLGRPVTFWTIVVECKAPSVTLGQSAAMFAVLGTPLLSGQLHQALQTLQALPW